MRGLKTGFAELMTDAGYTRTPPLLLAIHARHRSQRLKKTSTFRRPSCIGWHQVSGLGSVISKRHTFVRRAASGIKTPHLEKQSGIEMIKSSCALLLFVLCAFVCPPGVASCSTYCPQGETPCNRADWIPPLFPCSGECKLGGQADVQCEVRKAGNFANYLGNSSSAGQGVAGEGRQVALCVTANPALASHRVDCKMRSSPSEPASGSWASAWQLAETAVAAGKEALTTAAAAAAAAVAAAAAAACVGHDGQRSTSQPRRAFKALASKLRLSTGARFSGSWVMASVGLFFPSPVFAGR